MPSLIVRPKDQEPATIKLDRLRMTIGRSVRSDVPLRDPFASRLHAVVQTDGSQVLLVDMGSANGTFVNEQPVEEPRRLAPGDTIRIGDTLLHFLGEDRPSLPPPSVLLSGPEQEPLPDTETTIVSDAAALLTALRGPLHRESISDELTETGAPVDRRGTQNLLGVISKVGVMLLPKTSLSETLMMTMQLVLEAIPAERGFLFMRDRGDVRCQIARSLEGPLPTNPPARVSRSIIGKVLREGVLVLTANAAEDPRFAGHSSVQIGAIRSVMAAPLGAGADTLGMIYVDNAIHDRFTQADLSVLATIAAVATIKVEQEQLRAELIEKRRMEEELKIASEIQMRLLPIAPPRIEGWDLTGVSLPCREIGGDYYDFILRKTTGTLTLALGDVAGKGIGAALLMSSVHAAVRAQAQVSSEVTYVMGKLNEYICENAPSNRFVTLFYGELDPRTGLLRYANAGHNHPILVRATGEVERLVPGGLAIGIAPEEQYEEGAVTLEPGDALVIFSDGISEAMNPEGEEFGDERVVHVARTGQKSSASALRDAVEEAVSQFVGSAPPHDDTTLMVVMRAR